MSNPGNTGQRYKSPRRVSAEIVGQHILIKLECGHSYLQPAYDMSNGLEIAYTYAVERVGKRQRCNDCAVDGSEVAG